MDVKLGNVAELIKDSDAFKLSFSRVAADPTSNWNPEKHLLRGKKGTVVEIYEDKTIALIFSDGQQFDFPLESIGLTYVEDEAIEQKVNFDIDNHVGDIPITIHDHPLIFDGVVSYWGCNGMFVDGGCRSGSKSVFYGATGKYKCSIGCDYDLCKECVVAWIGNSGSNAAASMDQFGHLTVVHQHLLIEAFTRSPWRCLGSSLSGGCKGGLPDDLADRGRTSRYICRDHAYGCIDLCRSCFDAYEVLESPSSNSEGVPTATQYDSLHELCARHYCGRDVGVEGYHPKSLASLGACQTCVGVCGPRGGCQCASCFSIDAKPRVSKHMLAQALKKNCKEWRRSKIMIVGEGRAGKTSLANSITGKQFSNTESTVGINQLTCNVNYAALGEGSWGECKKPDKEYENAIAENVLNEQKKKLLRQQKKKKKTVTMESLSETKAVDKSREDGEKSVAITSLEWDSTAAVSAPPEVDQSFVLDCLAENVDLGTMLISIFDYGGQSVFNVIHHFFLTRYGVYCLVFNMVLF
jgi:GTPase SAR1 family protein